MIHCGHGWLPAQFLSPQYNKRTDEYGGSFENRARFTVDLLKTIREAMGPDFVIEIRVSSSEHLSGGLELEDAVKYCKLCELFQKLGVHNCICSAWTEYRAGICDQTKRVYPGCSSWRY